MSKILKGNELGGGNDFFSGLGFVKEQVVEEKAASEEKPSVTPEPKKEEKPHDDFFAQATSIAKSRKAVNARVISSGKKPETKPSSSGGRANVGFSKGKSRPISRRKIVSSAKDDQDRKEIEKIVQKKKKPKEAKTSETLMKKEEIVIGTTITVKELSEKMGISLQELMKEMIQNKVLGGVNTALDYDTASLLADSFDVKVKKEDEQVSVEDVLLGDLQSILDMDKEAENLEHRPPVVTVMGHVDHGKTSLLDYLRKSNVAGGEAGGITQSIGASMITHKDQKITFIDTPGHELFTSLRARGAKITNIAIIIIAAEDGLKPQTIESINHAKESGVPIIVAVTKIDKVEDHKRQGVMEQIKAEIGKYDLIPEDWGGDVPLVPLSSITGEGIPELLEHILLQAEVLELKYNPERKAVGVVVDAQKDVKQGISTSMIILTGTLRMGDVIVVHNTYGKVKRMINRAGKPVKEVSGGEPVMILGLNDIPEPGRMVECVPSEKDAQQRISLIQDQMHQQSSQSTVQKFLDQMKDDNYAVLKLILKSDGPSSLEALQQAIDHIPLPEGIEIKKIHNDVGIFTESDLALAQASDALLIGFNTKIPSSVKKKADQQKLVIKNYNIIYELVEYIEEIVTGMIEVEQQEVVIGKLDVLATFFKKEKMMVIGGKIIEGEARNGAKFRIMRNDEEIGQGEITSLQKEQESVKKMATGHECGMKIRTSKRVEEGDILEMYVME